MAVQDMTLFVYNLTLIPMTFFSVLFIILSVTYLLTNRKRERYGTLNEVPFVTVQIPTFNDPIGTRCIERCLRFDYPRDRYEIVIADDSTSGATQNLLASYADAHPGLVKYVHRKHRRGFKPGALKNATKHSRGEIIVIFDADWMPKRGFLKEIVRPFADPDVAIVQTRQAFYNHRKNLITRFAAYTLMVYHTIIMPLHSRANTVFFCGTAGALRRNALESVGGWNTGSLTEDSDLTVRLLLAGYRTVYVDHGTLSEVPETFEGFVKQQMRWCYGNTRVFIDHMPSILFSRKLRLRQRFMITYVTFGNIIAPVVVLMTVFGFSGWFLGDPALFNINDLITLTWRFLLTVGFIAMGTVMLWRSSRLDEFRYLLLSTFTVGLVLAVANSVAFGKAVVNRPLQWFCTPKQDNTKLVAE